MTKRQTSKLYIPQHHSILLIEDEKSMQELLCYLLGKENHVITTASNGQEALSLLQKREFDLIIQDMRLPDMEGTSLLRAIKEQDTNVPVIVITAFSHWTMAVEAMRLGAFDFVKKPFDNKNIRSVVHRALRQKQMLANLSTSERKNHPKIIGNSRAIQQIQDLIRRVAPTDSTVLIYGESGTGKELVARSVHAYSLRCEDVFIPINCGALAETLLESELFGHVKGAFTNAIRDKKGLIEVADHGSFFFDEIGEMSAQTQVKLLRVLEEREFIPLGGTQPKNIDIRFIAATNRDLEEAVKRGEFREDLFYRLNVIPIKVPALRERKEDIPLLAGHFLAIHASKMHKSVTGFSAEVMDMLMNYRWPGNIRELCNVIQRLIVLCETDVITKEDLGGYFREIPEQAPDFLSLPEKGLDLDKKLAEVECHYIRQALKRTEGNLTKAAELLQLSFRSIRYKVKKYQLKANDE